ncbi:MAG: DUF4363 family protein [Eubacterium sp.]
MKRLWFAGIFIVIVISLCVGEQIYIEKIYSDLNNEISKAEQYESQEDLEAAIKNIQNYWDKNNDLLFAIADHGVLDDLSAEIQSLDPNDEDIESVLTDIRALNKVFYENQRISPTNIF